MALILASDVVNVTYGCQFSTQLGLNRVQYFVSAAGGPALQDQDVANLLSTAVAASFKNYLNVGARYLGLRLQKVFVGPAAPGVSSTNGNGIGTIAGDALPTQTSMLFTKKTAVGGRIGRGRLYLPFWSEADNDANASPNAGALAAGNACATFLLTPITLISGASSVVLTPCLAKKSTGWIPLQLTGFVPRTQWATQRRRSKINKGDGNFPPS